MKHSRATLESAASFANPPVGGDVIRLGTPLFDESGIPLFSRRFWSYRRCASVLAKWLFHFKHTFIESSTGCWRSTLRGRPCKSLNGIRDPRLYRVAFMAWNGRDIRPGMVASHLCGRRDCFNPLHIVEETQAVNVSRSFFGCPGQIVCRQHGCVLEKVCVHKPPCHQMLLIRCCRPAGD